MTPKAKGNSQDNTFFHGLADWSRWKHAILNKYLHVWVNHMQIRSKTLAYIDTCAGAGSYGTGEDGSPVLAAKWNDAWLHAQGARLVVIACEADPTNFASLQRALIPWSSRTPPEAIVIQSAFGDAFEGLLDATRSVPTFLFVDPYGMRAITADQLSPLLGDSKQNRERTEILIRVDPVLLARFSGWLPKKERSAKAEKTAAAFRELLKGFQISDEKMRYLEQENVYDRDSVLLDEYLRVLNERFDYVTPIPIRPKYDAAPKYMLVHGTDSEHGVAKMNDILSTTEDELYRDTEKRREAPGQASLFDLETVTIGRSWFDETSLDRTIRAVLADGKPRRCITVRAHLARTFGPWFREKHHRAALKRLHADGAISLTNAGKSGTAIGDYTVVRLSNASVATRP